MEHLINTVYHNLKSNARNSVQNKHVKTWKVVAPSEPLRVARDTLKRARWFPPFIRHRRAAARPPVAISTRTQFEHVYTNYLLTHRLINNFIGDTIIRATLKFADFYHPEEVRVKTHISFAFLLNVSIKACDSKKIVIKILGSDKNGQNWNKIFYKIRLVS